MNIGIPEAMNMITNLNYTPGGYEICSNIQLHAQKVTCVHATIIGVLCYN